MKRDFKSMDQSSLPQLPERVEVTARSLKLRLVGKQKKLLALGCSMPFKKTLESKDDVRATVRDAYLPVMFLPNEELAEGFLKLLEEKFGKKFNKPFTMKLTLAKEAADKYTFTGELQSLIEEVREKYSGFWSFANPAVFLKVERQMPSGAAGA